jgi:hypothetical protein
LATATRLATIAAIVLGLGAASRAIADTYAYEGTGNDDFGVIDITTGVYTSCGTSAVLLSGLGVGGNKTIYGGAFRGNAFYSVTPNTGALKLVGTSNVTFWDTGSTTNGVYAVGTDANLYSINITNGQGTLIGATGIPVDNGYYGLSTNAKALYYSHGATLYTLNLKTGAPKLIGTASAGIFGAELLENGLLYAGSESPLAMYTLNTKTGQSTPVSTVSGTSGVFWGLVPIKAKKISRKKICELHPI